MRFRILASCASAATTSRSTSPDKLFFPERGLTKGDLVSYYVDVAELALPHLRRRPFHMKRFPNGVDGEFFHQKRVPANHPEYVDEVFVQFPSGHSTVFAILDNAAALAWVANLGCIELHTWHSRVPEIEQPDYLLIDLDPTTDGQWPFVREIALVVREVMDELGLRSYPKTSGATGLHILAPIKPELPFPDVRAVREGARARRSSGASATRRSRRRRGASPTASACSSTSARTRATARSPRAYSVRPTPDARVSAPLLWDEVATVEPEAFTIETMRDADRGSRRPDATGCGGARRRCARASSSSARRSRRGPRRLSREPRNEVHAGTRCEHAAASPSCRTHGARRLSAQRAALDAVAAFGSRGGRSSRHVQSGGVLVVAPADELRAVPEAVALHLVVAHLDDELRPHARSPRDRRCPSGSAPRSAGRSTRRAAAGRAPRPPRASSRRPRTSRRSRARRPRGRDRAAASRSRSGRPSSSARRRTTQSAVLCSFIFTTPSREPGRYGSAEPLRDHAVEPERLEAVEPAARLGERRASPARAESRASASTRARRSSSGSFHTGSPSQSEHVEDDVLRRDLRRQPADARLRRMKPHLHRVEVERAVAGDHDLAVERRAAAAAARRAGAARGSSAAAAARCATTARAPRRRSRARRGSRPTWARTATRRPRAARARAPPPSAGRE